MKKGLLFVVALFSLARANADETQISFGVDYGIGTFSVDNDFGTVDGTNPLLFNETSMSVLFAPGFGFTMRKFPENMAALNIGFFFHCNMLFATNIHRWGTLKTFRYPSPTTKSISDTLSGDDFLYAVAANFNLGSSNWYKTSKKIRFYADSGLNVSVFSYKSKYESEEGASLNYVGVGLFVNSALQFNVTEKFYIEAGLNGTMNFISHQEGYYTIGQVGKIEYEDTGKIDLMWLVSSIHIGWYIR